MSRNKKDVIDEVSEELDVKISRANPLKTEWVEILTEIRELKKRNERLTNQLSASLGGSSNEF